MFFLAEYANMLNVSAIATTLFLGGWQSPIPINMPIPEGSLLETLGPIFWFVTKILGFILLYMWLRATLPRLRYDQLMRFTWKGLVPICLANIMVIATVLTLYYGPTTPSAGATSQSGQQPMVQSGKLADVTTKAQRRHQGHEAGHPKAVSSVGRAFPLPPSL
jgi:hypothetical protein